LLTGEGVTVLSLAVNGALTAVKVAAGLIFSSQTIIADGLHSGSDLITDVAVLAGLRVSNRPPDQCHRYGHYRISTLVAMLLGAVLMGAAALIAYKALMRLHGPDGQLRAAFPFWVAIASVPIKEGLFRLTRLVGKRTRNLSLLANAWHHRTDALSSLAAAVGLAGVLIGGQDWHFLDAVTALLLSAFLLLVAVRIMGSSASELIDRAPDSKTLSVIEAAVARTPGVRGYHAFRARHVGGKVETDIHIQVDPDLTIRSGHEIAGAVKRKVMQADPNVVEVIVHIEPAEPDEADRR